jgi:hypothetical protein
VLASMIPKDQKNIEKKNTEAKNGATFYSCHTALDKSDALIYHIFV